MTSYEGDIFPPSRIQREIPSIGFNPKDRWEENGCSFPNNLNKDPETSAK